MERLRFALVSLMVLGASCAPPSAALSPTPAPLAEERGVEPHAQPPQTAPVSTAETEPPEAGAADSTLSIAISPEQTCELTLRAFQRTAEPEYVGNIERLAVQPSEGCAATVILDVSGDPDPVPAYGGAVVRGYVADPLHEVAGLQIADMNFDGLADLCVLWRANGVGSTIAQWRGCWLFDAEAQTFVFNDPLSKLVWPVFDPVTKTIEAGITFEGDRAMGHAVWAMGDSFSHGRYRWSGSTLETVEEATIYLLGKPGGPAPPKGNLWMTRDQRRGGKLIRVYDGPCGNPRPCRP
ncbi:MAG: hypothetical protein R3B72_39035 [Polyangiaceae bacterium]